MVFLAAVGTNELFILGLDIRITDGIGFLVVAEQLADEKGLARELHLDLEVFGGVEALFLGFLNEDFAGNHFFLQLGLHFWRDRAAGTSDLLRQCVHARTRNRFAVDDGNVLGHCQRRRSADDGGHKRGDQFQFHA